MTYDFIAFRCRFFSILLKNYQSILKKIVLGVSNRQSSFLSHVWIRHDKHLSDGWLDINRHRSIRSRTIFVSNSNVSRKWIRFRFIAATKCIIIVCSLEYYWLSLPFSSFSQSFRWSKSTIAPPLRYAPIYFAKSKNIHSQVVMVGAAPTGKDVGMEFLSNHKNVKYLVQGSH